MNQRISLSSIYGTLALMGFLFLFLSLSIGPVEISRSELLFALLGSSTLPDTIRTVLWDLRLPRAIGSFVIGGSLAAAGLAMQGIFRNPLAAPGVLGISSGGAFGAIVMILLGAHHPFSMTVGAFVMALGTLALVYLLATQNGYTPMTTLLLAGLAIGAFYTAMIGLAMTLVNPHRLQQFLFWLLGGLDGLRWTNVRSTVLIVIPVIGFLWFEMKKLDLLSQGEAAARSMGISVRGLKIRTLVWVTLLTATAVSISGVIGFVGLIVPHVIRMLIGPNHRRMFVPVFLSGGVFLMGCDVLSRWVIAPVEIRVGIITALTGVPFFLYLLRKRVLGWGGSS